MPDTRAPIQSTAGAIPLKNDKGQVYMEKVRVQRYIAGKRPDYAQGQDSSTDEDADYDDFNHPHNERDRAIYLEELSLMGEVSQQQLVSNSRQKRTDLSAVFPLAKATISKPIEDRPSSDDEEVVQYSRDEVEKDPRLRRLMRAAIEEQEHEYDSEEELEDRVQRHKRLREPEILPVEPKSDQHVPESITALVQEDSEEEDDEQLQRRREMIRERALMLRQRQEEEDSGVAVSGGGEPVVSSTRHRSGMDGADEAMREELLLLSEGEDEDDNEDEDEDSMESDDEFAGHGARSRRLKPTFVRRRDRVTLQAAKKEQERAVALMEQEKRRADDERRRQTIRMLNELKKVAVESEDASKAAVINKPATLALQAAEGVTAQSVEVDEAKKILAACNALNSSADEDEGNEEIEYESWKVRELARIRREREIDEQRLKEKRDVEKLRQMNDDELRKELKRNPRYVTNKQSKGHYRFLQKYYHRGAFFVHNEDNDIFKRDFTQPTLEDHFDKTRLPKVMQVKNFGLAGRTKYTHLVDQDTSRPRGSNEEGFTLKPHPGVNLHDKMKGGGEKQIFNRPSAKKKKL